MEQTAAPFNKREWSLRTLIATKRVEETLKQAHELATDPRRQERKERCQCRACFYSEPRIAGQAFTNRPCACCDEVQQYSSTNTDVLCLACALKNSLCKHCGADISLNRNRTTWPEEKP